eukprot:gene6171-1102_t
MALSVALVTLTLYVNESGDGRRRALSTSGVNHHDVDEADLREATESRPSHAHPPRSPHVSAKTADGHTPGRPGPPGSNFAFAIGALLSPADGHASVSIVPVVPPGPRAPPVPPPLSKPWEPCSNEGHVCHCAGLVRYGRPDHWSVNRAVDGVVECSNAAWSDPAPHQLKECQCSGNKLPSTLITNPSPSARPAKASPNSQATKLSTAFTLQSPHDNIASLDGYTRVRQAPPMPPAEDNPALMADLEFRYGAGTRARIQQLQFPSSCKKGRYLRGKSLDVTGHGNRLNLLAACLSMAFIQNRTWVPQTELMTGFISSWGDCGPDDIPQMCSHRGNTRMWSSAVPDEYAEYGGLWWRTQLVWWLTRLTPEYQKFVDQYVEDKLQEGAHKPTLGVHLRFSKEKTLEAGHKPVPAYEGMALNMMARQGHNISRAYFASDLVGVKKEWAREFTESVFDWVQLPSPLIGRWSKWAVHLNQAGKAKNPEAVVLMLAMHLMSRCDYFVGTYSSNFGRIVMSMKLASDFCTQSVGAVDNKYYEMKRLYYLLPSDYNWQAIVPSSERRNYSEMDPAEIPWKKPAS